jgi:hypothetical protein
MAISAKGFKIRFIIVTTVPVYMIYIKLTQPVRYESTHFTKASLIFGVNALYPALMANASKYLPAIAPAS